MYALRGTSDVGCTCCDSAILLSSIYARCELGKEADTVCRITLDLETTKKTKQIKEKLPLQHQATLKPSAGIVFQADPRS